MKKIEMKAYGKINLSLDILGKRDDGYHEVDMIMTKVNIHDEIIVEKTNKGIKIVTDSHIIPDDKNNLCYKAAKIFFQDTGIDGGAVITIIKRIPVAAGMAGGSSDAASVLACLNKLYKKNLDFEKLSQMGVKVGADVPFCIADGTFRARGIGEKLNKINSKTKLMILVAKPSAKVSTKDVYKNYNDDLVKKRPDNDSIEKALIYNDINLLINSMENVLESVTIKQHEIISRIKNIMIGNGAIKSLMTGSGPTVYGIFESIMDMEKAKRKLSVICTEVFTTTTRL